MKSLKPAKPYWEMTPAELKEATKEFDSSIPLSRTRALTKAEQARLKKAKDAPAKSIFILKDSEGALLVRLEPNLMKRASRYAVAQRLTLSEVINRSLKGLLAMVE